MNFAGFLTSPRVRALRSTGSVCDQAISPFQRTAQVCGVWVLAKFGGENRCGRVRAAHCKGFALEYHRVTVRFQNNLQARGHGDVTD